MNHQCGVYVIRCEPTGNEYVGASVHIIKRIREHFYRLEKGIHGNHRLQNTYNKYGKDSFRSEVLLYCDPNNLEMYGNRLIEKFQPEFNIVHTEHTKGKKIRAMNRSAKAILKNLDARGRFIKKLERIQKRTHRL
jgi:group I intron endonuclease